MTTTYRPITVIQPGLVLFDCFGGMHMQHWMLDLGGRAPRADWQTAYREEITEAVAAYIARRCARMEPMVSPAADLEAAQLLQRLQHREPNPGAFRRPWWQRLWDDWQRVRLIADAFAAGWRPPASKAEP